MNKDMKLIMENWRQFSNNDLNKIDKRLAKSLHEVNNIKDPFFRRKLKNLSLNAEDCQVYLKESNGELKYIGFDQLIERRNSGKITSDEVHEIWESSCKYDINMFGSYGKLHAQLFNEMLADGLIMESGAATQKGRLLREQEEDLTEQQINETINNLILEQPEDEEEELSPEEKAATQSTGRRALGKIGKAIGGAVMAPFKLLKWFRDKIWGFISGMLTKLWVGIKQLGEKWDLKWVKSFTNMVESVIDKIKVVCEKNKMMKIICGIVKAILIAYAVKLFITAFLAMIGSSFAALTAMTLGGCAAGAAQAAVSEGKRKQLIKEDASLCDAAVKATKATANFSFQIVKGVIKKIAASSTDPGMAKTAQEALSFVDKFSESYYSRFAAPKVLGVSLGSDAPIPASDVDPSGLFTADTADTLYDLKQAARACTSEGAKLVTSAVDKVQNVIAAGKAAILASKPGAEKELAEEVYHGLYEQVAKLGKAVGGPANVKAYLEQSNLFEEAIKIAKRGSGSREGIEAAKDLLGRLARLGDAAGFKTESLDNLVNVATRNMRVATLDTPHFRAAAQEFGTGAAELARGVGKAKMMGLTPR
tara:strand:+ start:122 stop:1897 length:1776 start_codon:yes stop_codon:yes gene_type:complete